MSDSGEHKIVQIDEEKRLRIINAGINEFSKGYRQASTDVIVREAGISKGLLFYYFGTKKDLFLYLYDYAVQTVLTELSNLVDLNERDFLLRWRQQLVSQCGLCRKYPSIFRFLRPENLINAQKVLPELWKYKKTFHDHWPKMLVNIDTSLFRSDLSAEDVYKTLLIFIQGYTAQIFHRHEDFDDITLRLDELLREFDTYIAILRKCFYTQEN
ncbi:MAG: TetR/AcrR family transcriptional regulator [Peptococcaceae bacterium]|jgi:AcrR family transcriptional regulator|nr:TetR/AcrR family transcriptional regulator [Peptococcaceae bacterium]